MTDAGGVSRPPGLAELIADAATEHVLAGESGTTVLRLTAADGSVYYLKHGRGSVPSDIVDEMVRLRWLHARLPCAEMLHFVEHGDAAWLLTSGVTGRSGDEWLQDDPTKLDRVIDSYAAFLRRLHAMPVNDCPFNADAGVRMAAARINLSAGRIDKDDFDDDHRGWTGEQMWDELVRLRPGQETRVVTHGDYSLENLLLDDDFQPTGLIDVGRLGAADPYQDIAILWQNLSDFGTAAQGRWLTAYGINAVDQNKLAFYRCLDEMF